MSQRVEDGTAADAARALRGGFQGEVIVPGNPSYDDARRVWNGCVDRRPALIARCTSTDDVVAALRVARGHGLGVAVRGGGHSLAGHAVADGALTIDLSGMRSVRVDARSRRASVEGGCLLSDVDQETQRHGLAVTSGLVSHTGMAGLTLGGGLGWMARSYGLACDNLLSAQVVTADGTVAVASEERDADLLWALRGGGGNFGIVTSFEYRLHQVGPAVVNGAGFYRIEDGGAVLEVFRQLAAESSDETTWVASVFDAEPGSPLPQEFHGEPVVALVFVHLGSPEDGLALGRHLRRPAQPLAEVVGPLPYTELQASNDGGWRHGVRRYWRSHYLPDLPDAAVNAFLGRGSATGSGAGVSGTLLTLGGAISRVGEDAAAVGHRDAAFDFQTVTSWTDPGEDDDRRADVRRYADAMTSYARGVYLNNLGDEGDDRIRAAYGPHKYERLVTLKRRYDPQNVFCLNQNIRP